MMQFKNDMTDAVWSQLGNIAGDNTLKSFTDPINLTRAVATAGISIIGFELSVNWQGCSLADKGRPRLSQLRG